MISLEVRVQRRLTKAFIDANSVEIRLIPVAKTKTAAGGFTEARSPARLPQRVSLLRAQTQGGSNTNKTETLNGVIRERPHAILGVWDMAVEDGDVFVIDGMLFRVDGVDMDRRYETKASISFVRKATAEDG